MTREEGLLVRRMLTAVGGMAAFFLLARQCGRPWFPLLPAALSGWTCGTLLRGKAFRRFRDPAMAAGLVLPLLAVWAPGAAVGAGATGALVCLVLSEGSRSGRSSTGRAVACVLGVSTACSGLAMLGRAPAVLVVFMASWTAFLCLRVSVSGRGLVPAVLLGWLAGYGTLAAELSEAPGTIDMLAGAGWCAGVALLALLGAVGAGYAVRTMGIRRPEWFVEPLLAPLLAAPGAAALLSIIPVFLP